MNLSGPNNGRYTHGHYVGGKSRTRATWDAMIQRCTNPARPFYNRYGGRGIKVCTRWLKFDNFLADMGERPEGMTLDRYPNRNGHYEPDNCRWATSSQQALNKDRAKTVPAPRIDISGWRFGRLVAESFVRINERRQSIWSFRCDCGQRKQIIGVSVTSGKTHSCGCLQRDVTIARNRRKS